MITLFIEPVAWARTRVNPRTGTFITAPKMRTFQTSIKLMLGKQSPLIGDLKVTFRFYMRPPKKKARERPGGRPDLSNLIKNVEDAANGILWRDDAQIVAYGEGTGKYYDFVTLEPRIEIEIEEVTP